MKYGITLNMIVDDILNDKNGGMPNDDYSREQIIFKILGWRELFIRRDIEKNGINSIYQQTIYCLPLELTDQVICCGINTDCKILRSVDKIPQLLRVKGKYGFTVTSTDDSDVFPAIRHNEAKRIADSRFSYKMKRSFIKPDGYLYIINDKFTRYVNFTSIFFDPREVARFSNCSGEPCYTDDDPFPLSGDLIRAIYVEIMKEITVINNYDEIKDKKKEIRPDEIERS